MPKMGGGLYRDTAGSIFEHADTEHNPRRGDASHGGRRQTRAIPRMQIVKFILAGALRLIAVLALAGPMVALGGVAIGPGTAQAQGVIRDIKVSGNRRVEAETVRSYLSISPGETYTAGKGDAAINCTDKRTSK